METKEKIGSSAKVVDNEKSAKQRKELEQAEAAAKAARQAALDAREKNAAAAKSTTSKAKKKSDDSGLLEGVLGANAAKVGTDIAKQLMKEAMKKKRKSKSLVVLGFFAVIVLAAAVIIGPKLMSMLEPEQPPVAVINEMTDEEKAEILKNKQIEIQKIVLNESVQRKELLVLEQDIQVESVFESALGGFEVFKKAKKIVSYGTGYFNVNLASLTEDKINVDHDKKTVTVTVPHAYLKSISVDEGKTQYEDTQKGLLSFGELKLTMEQQGLLKQSVEDSMREELNTPEMLEEADRVGKAMVAQIYQPFVSAISDEYYVQVEIAEREPDTSEPNE